MKSYLKFLNIEEIKELFDDQKSYMGYLIDTNKNSYKLLILDEDICCERWGCITSEDNYKDFIGTELISIENPYYLDNIINSPELKFNLYNTTNNEETFAVFINVNTSDGLLQFVVYNVHNGYYGHGVLFIKNDKTIKKFIA